MALAVKRFERLVSVCLDGSLLAQVQEATHRSLVAARLIQEGLSVAKLAELTADYDRLADEARALSASAEAETVVFRVRAMPGHVWDKLVEDHPPLPDGDSVSEQERYAEALNAALSYTNDAHPEWKSIVEVKRLDGTVEPFAGKDWPDFAAELATEQIFDFHDAILTLNVGANAVPFLPPASKPSPRYAKK